MAEMKKNNMSGFQRFDAIITNGTKWACFSLLMLLVLNIAVSISLRYVFHISFSFSEKLSVYLLLWFTFLGASLAAKYNRHIAVNTLVRVLSPNAQKTIWIIGQIIGVLFVAYMIYFSLVHVTNQRGVEPLVFYIKKAYFSSALPLSMVLMLYQINSEQIQKYLEKRRQQ